MKNLKYLNGYRQDTGLIVEYTPFDLKYFHNQLILTNIFLFESTVLVIILL